MICYICSEGKTVARGNRVVWQNRRERTVIPSQQQSVYVYQIVPNTEMSIKG